MVILELREKGVKKDVSLRYGRGGGLRIVPEMREKDAIHFSVLVTPVIPSSWGNDPIHVSKSKDHPRKSAPRPSQEQCT